METNSHIVGGCEIINQRVKYILIIFFLYFQFKQVPKTAQSRQGRKLKMVRALHAKKHVYTYIQIRYFTL